MGLYCWLLAARDGLENVKGTSRHLEAAGPGLPNGPTLVGVGEGLSLATVEVSTWPETIGGTRGRFWLPKIALEAFEEACGILRSASQASHMASPTIYYSYVSSSLMSSSMFS